MVTLNLKWTYLYQEYLVKQWAKSVVDFTVDYNDVDLYIYVTLIGAPQVATSYLLYGTSSVLSFQIS